MKCEKSEKIKTSEQPKFRNLYINFGCKRDPSKKEQHQLKDISKRWFVYYDFLLPTGLYSGFKIYGYINREHTVATRYDLAVQLRDQLQVLIEEYGFNPVTKALTPRKVSAVTDPGEQIRQLPICEAIEWAFEKHSPNLAHKTRADIKSVLKYVYAAIHAINYNSITVGEFKKSPPSVGDGAGAKSTGN